MEQSKQDLENIKSKLIEHLKSSYSEEKANEYISNINSMDDKGFIEFLKQQGILKEDGSQAQQNQCIFCSMVFNEMPTTKINENEKAIAILDINPASLGHTLIIPKEHIGSEDKITIEIKNLANQVSEELKKTFKPQRVDLLPANVMGHQIINLLPVYDNESLESERKKQTPEQLNELKKKIDSSKPEQITQLKPSEEIKEEKQEQEEINEKNTWLPRRIP